MGARNSAPVCDFQIQYERKERTSRDLRTGKELWSNTRNVVDATTKLKRRDTHPKLRDRDKKSARSLAHLTPKHTGRSGHCSSYYVQSFDLYRIVGQGLMGTVRVAQLKSEGTWCALKAVRKDYVTKHNDGRHVQNERDLLLELQHPFIVRLFGTFQDSVNIYFVMEFLPGGELYARLKKEKSFSPNVSKFYLSEILVALEYMHTNDVCYRDLKPENVLLDAEGHCKFVDFGFSCRAGAGDPMRTSVGTPAYLSPELLNGKFTGGYLRIVDWWAFGILTYELLSGKTPFSKNNQESPYSIYLRVLKGKIPFNKSFPKQARSLVKMLLQSSINERLVDPQGIRTHAWFEDMRFDEVSQRRLKPPFSPDLSSAGDWKYFNRFPGDDAPLTDEVRSRSITSNAIDESLFSDF